MGLSLLLAAAASLAVAPGCKKSDAPAVVCTETDDKAECVPMPFQTAPAGESKAPLLEELIKNVAPNASTSVTVTAAGGTASLPDGLRLVIPAGALPAGARVDIGRHDMEPAIYRFTSTMPLAGKVDITFPVPGALDNPTPEQVYVLWFHDAATHPKALTGTIDAAAKTITVSTTEFSSGVPVNAQAPAPGTGDRITRMPYYNQGNTKNCWSIALLMLMVGYGAQIEPWDINAFFKISAEHGLSYWAYNHSSNILTFLKKHVPGYIAERKSWFTGATNTDLHNYLARNMRAGRPTMVWYDSPAEHMVVFVGIEGDKFVIHDPGQGVYVRETWDMIWPRFKNLLFDGTGTLAFDSPPPKETTWTASLLLPFAAERHNGMDFVATRDDGRFDNESTMVYAWYVPALMGPGLLNLGSMKPGSLNDRYHVYANLNVTNIVDEAASRSYAVGLEIKNTAGAAVYTHPEVMVSNLAGRTDRDVSLFPGARGKPIKDLVKEAGDYVATFYVAEGGTRGDTINVPFKVGKAAKPTACAQLTSDFRSGCAKSGACTCVGNAFCEGFQESGPKSCQEATQACGFHCLVFDKGDCECERYCTAFLSRIGC